MRNGSLREYTGPNRESGEDSLQAGEPRVFPRLRMIVRSRTAPSFMLLLSLLSLDDKTRPVALDLASVYRGLCSRYHRQPHHLGYLPSLFCAGFQMPRGLNLTVTAPTKESQATIGTSVRRNAKAYREQRSCEAHAPK